MKIYIICEKIGGIICYITAACLGTLPRVPTFSLQQWFGMYDLYTGIDIYTYDVFMYLYTYIQVISNKYYLHILNIDRLMRDSLTSKAVCRILSTGTGKFALFSTLYLSKNSVTTCL